MLKKLLSFTKKLTNRRRNYDSIQYRIWLLETLEIEMTQDFLCDAPEDFYSHVSRLCKEK